MEGRGGEGRGGEGRGGEGRGGVGEGSFLHTSYIHEHTTSECRAATRAVRMHVHVHCKEASEAEERKHVNTCKYTTYMYYMFLY